MVRTLGTLRLPVALLLALTVLGFSLGCRSSSDVGEESDLVWEAWDSIKESYVLEDRLDSEAVVSSMVQSLLDLTETPPYPFLTTVGRLRGQPPVGIPPELADVWRALVLHQKRWPEYQVSELVDAAILGMLEGLDDSSVFFLASEESYAEALESVAGSYAGIGASVIVEEDRILLFPGEDTQAEKADLEPADVLLEVGGESVAGLTVAEVADKVRGPAGTKVELLVERVDEPEPLQINVIRGNIELPSVAFQLVPGGIGYIGINQFRENTGEKVIEALETLKRIDMLGLILDLRANPGGSPEAARQMVSQFLPAGGLFMYEIDRLGNRKDWVTLEEGLVAEGLLMAVLVNEGTAGVAEAVAAVLQATDRAEIIGTQTAGKGSTNTFVELSNGSAIYLPTALWYTPGDELLEGVGVEPDTWVPLQAENQGFGRESQFNRAYEYLDNQLLPFR